MITSKMLRDDALAGIGAQLDPVSAWQVADSMDSNSALAEDNFKLRQQVMDLEEGLRAALLEAARYRRGTSDDYRNILPG